MKIEVAAMARADMYLWQTRKTRQNREIVQRVLVELFHNERKEKRRDTTGKKVDRDDTLKGRLGEDNVIKVTDIVI